MSMFSRGASSLFAAILVVVTCDSLLAQTSCEFAPDDGNKITVHALPRSAEIETSGALPARGGSVDWGLALSGGGIRSGSFGIGVMKALYDGNLLDKIDTISSVSGGGYAVYWLYGLDSAGNRFGDNAFRDDVFLKNTCELQTDSDMYSLAKMLKTLLRGKRAAFADYRANIHRTFGRSNCALAQKRVQTFQSDIEAGRIPYFVINTSLKTSELYGLANVVEITPRNIGNSILGFSSWSGDDGSSMGFASAIATSAAGIEAKVGNAVANFAPYTINNTKYDKNQVDLYDGGGKLGSGAGGENLAALALIRRGIKNVIIVDAGADPSYKYEDYFKLQRLLNGLGMDFCVSEGGKCNGNGNRERPPSILKTGVMKGYVRRAGTEQILHNIYYVKMTRPTEIFPKDRDAELSEMKKKERPSKIRDWYRVGFELTTKRNRLIGLTGRDQKEIVRCESAPKTIEPEMYRYLANSYGYYLDGTLWRHLGKFGGFLAYEFPHTTTADQSFYSDQMEAFIGLGFLEGRHLKQFLESEVNAE